MDYIDNNYAWQRRILTVFKKRKTSTPFPYAADIGVEFNPAFERHEKISVELLTNGAILDIHDFLKAVNKSAPFHLLDILNFNFDLDLDVDSPLFYTYASKVYSSAKSFKNEFKTRPLQLHAKLQDVFPLPDPALIDTDMLPQKSELGIPSALQLDERKGTPIVYKTPGRAVQISMDHYPLCKKGGVTFVLRPSNAPPTKLSPALLTGGMILEMLDFARILSGMYLKMLREIISHNFGEVYEPCYLSGQVKALSEKKVSIPTRELKESFCKETFKFMLRKVIRSEIRKRPQDMDSDVEIIPEKQQPEGAHSNDDHILQNEEINEASYMCPVEFETDIQENAGPENEQNDDTLVDVEVDFELDIPEVFQMREKKEKFPQLKKTQEPCYLGFQNIRKIKNIPVIPIAEIFSEDTLPMHQKTAKQKEWARRTNRIKEIFNKGIQDLFCRSRDIGLDFNVGSGRKQNLDMNLLTNHTLFEVNRFSVHLSKSVSVFLMDIMANFNLCFHDEPHERNFLSYLLGKEKTLLNQAHKQTVMSTPIIFPEGYNVMVPTTNDNKEQSDDVSGEDISDDFPYCRDINLNLWSLEERPANRKLDLAVITHGALLEIITFSRRLASNPRDLLNDILEHNFDVDLQDPTTEDSHGLNKWFAANKVLLKKPLCTLKTTVWLTEVISLKQYCLPKQQQFLSEIVNPIPVPKVQEYTYDICKEIGLELNVTRNSPSKQKLDMHLLTRGALFEVHNFVKSKCNRYVPALYEILDYNFDLSSQRHRKVELAWSIAAQVLAMVRKGERKGQYMQQVFELPFESKEGDCKEEPEEREIEETEPSSDDVVFVQKLIPVDVDVEID